MTGKQVGIVCLAIYASVCTWANCTTVHDKHSSVPIVEKSQEQAVGAQQPVKVLPSATESKVTKWANCRVTAYCPCEKCCGMWATKRPVDANGKQIVLGASGERLESYVSCASSLPFGTRLYIPELDLHTVVLDRASDSVYQKYNGEYVDIFIDDHDTCFTYLSGKPEYMEVYYEHQG